MRPLADSATAILPAVGQRRKHAAREIRSPWLRAVGKRFRELREENGVGQDELPSPRPTVSQFENGKGVNLALLETWCRAARIDPAALFTELPTSQATSSSDAPTLDDLQVGRLGGESMINEENKGYVVRFIGMLMLIPKEDHGAFATEVSRLADRWPKARGKPQRRGHLP